MSKVKSIVCFGDSNTFGHNPVDMTRYPETVRWPCILQGILGDDYKVIEEGLNGRTTVFEDPRDDWKNGLDYIKGILCSHRPVDILVIMLGTNDTKTVYNASASDIADGLEKIILSAKDVMEKKQDYIPKILVIAPHYIDECVSDGPFTGDFDAESCRKTRELAQLYQKVADKNDCCFMNAAEYINASKVDGVHLDPEEHRILAEKVAAKIRNIY